MKRLVPVLAAISLLAVITGCSSGDQVKAEISPPPGGILLKGAGATFPSPLYKQWFAKYQSDHAGTLLTYDSVGSGEGVRRFVGKNIKPEEKVDFGASDAAMKDDEIAQVSSGALMLPMTAGAVVLAYNLPELEGDLRLSRKAYTGIFLGEITNWNDRLIAQSNPGKKIPKLTLATVVRQDGSGTTYAFTKHLDAISEKWRGQFGAATLVNWPGNAMRASGNEGVAARIKQSVGSIGYVSYEFARALGLKMAVLENKEGRFVAPTEQSGTAALASADLPENLRFFIPDPAGPDSYPIVTLSWILLYRNYPDAEKSKQLHDLFGWCLRDGQESAARLSYLPLPAKVAAKSLAALATVTP